MNEESFKIPIKEIAFSSFKFYKDINEGKIKNFKGAEQYVSRIPVYTSVDPSTLGFYVQSELMKPKVNVTLDFGNGTTRDMNEYPDAMFVNTHGMMEYLKEYILEKKVKIIEQKIEDFGSIEGRIIFNCSGLGASSLNNDEKMLPVQGHFVQLINQDRENFPNSILVWRPSDSVGTTEHKQSVIRSLNLFPKEFPGSQKNDIGVLGGTFILGATNETPNEEEFEIIKHNARNFFGWKPKEI